MPKTLLDSFILFDRTPTCDRHRETDTRVITIVGLPAVS